MIAQSEYSLGFFDCTRSGFKAASRCANKRKRAGKSRETAARGSSSARAVGVQAHSGREGGGHAPVLSELERKHSRCGRTQRCRRNTGWKATCAEGSRLRDVRGGKVF